MLTTFTPLVAPLLSAFALAASPAPVAGPAPHSAVVATDTQSESERERAREREERLREQQQRQREQQREQAERQREQQREQAERQREQQRDQAERQREREQEKRERAHDVQSRRDRGGRGVVVDGERTSQTFKVGDAGSLHVNNLAGDIVVTGASGGEIRVDTLKHGRGASDSDARQQLANVDISVQKVGTRVEIETNHTRNSRAWVDYTISVPLGTTVELRSVSGDIRVSNVRGEVRAESVSGDVEATTLTRAASLKSVSGDVSATSVSSDTELSLSSVSGEVVAKSLKGRSTSVGTVSGDVTLQGCTCGQASVQSVSGSISYTGRLEKAGRYEFKTHSGDVLLASGGDGFDLDASTFSGSLRSEVPLITRGGDANFERGRGPGRWVKAVSGNGGAYVEIKTFSGDIVLTKAQ
jgi:DUF4097 and DUF4098 domain-containing protein YvlB